MGRLSLSRGEADQVFRSDGSTQRMMNQIALAMAVLFLLVSRPRRTSAPVHKHAELMTW